jgi:hypothetical protein
LIAKTGKQNSRLGRGLGHLRDARDVAKSGASQRSKTVEIVAGGGEEALMRASEQA